jgi:hypothetical protein
VVRQEAEKELDFAVDRDVDPESHAHDSRRHKRVCGAVERADHTEALKRRQVWDRGKLVKEGLRLLQVVNRSDGRAEGGDEVGRENSSKLSRAMRAFGNRL